MKKMLFVTLLAIPFILGVTPIVYGGAPLPPPPDGSKLKYVGPDITGTLTFEDTSTTEVSQVTITFNGSCITKDVTGRSEKISFEREETILGLAFLFDCISPEWLLGKCTQLGCMCTGYPEMLPDSLVPIFCYPDKDIYYYPVVYKVMHFIENGNTKSADIVGRWPVLNP